MAVEQGAIVRGRVWLSPLFSINVEVQLPEKGGGPQTEVASEHAFSLHPQSQHASARRPNGRLHKPCATRCQG